MSLFKKKASESASPAASPAAPRPAAAAHSSTATSAGHHVSSPAHATTSSSSTTSANEKHSSTSHPPNTTSATSTAHTIATTTAKSTAASTTQPTTTNPAPEKKKPSMAMSIDGEATEANNSKAADHDGDDGATTPTASRSPSPSRRVQLGVASKVVEENKAKYKLTDFRLLETLGTGTFGRVLLCKHKSTDEYYAMKMLKKMEVVRLKQVEHINSEKEILCQINHPFLVNLFCTFQDDQNLYMLLEYVLGGELFSHLRRAGKFPNDTCRFYAAEIVLALEYLHSLDIIYRDLKPENLLLDAQGHVKITDFGFAKKVEDRTWTLCGTPEYLAPEIIQSKGHGKAVDWWALGILIYEMLAGFPPFYDEHPFGIYEKILAGKLIFPPHFDPNAKDLIKRFLTADRTKRLGNLKGGADDVRQHKWFKGIDWDLLLDRQLPSPIEIKATHAGDTRNFEKYPEINLEDEMRPTGNDPFKNLFKGF